MIDGPVAEKPLDNTPRGRLRALYDWMVTRAAPSPPSDPSLSLTPPPDEVVPTRIGHYAIARKLGQGRGRAASRPMTSPAP